MIQESFSSPGLAADALEKSVTFADKSARGEFRRADPSLSIDDALQSERLFVKGEGRQILRRIQEQGKEFARDVLQLIARRQTEQDEERDEEYGVMVSAKELAGAFFALSTDHSQAGVLAARQDPDVTREALLMIPPAQAREILRKIPLSTQVEILSEPVTIDQTSTLGIAHPRDLAALIAAQFSYDRGEKGGKGSDNMSAAVLLHKALEERTLSLRGDVKAEAEARKTDEATEMKRRKKEVTEILARIGKETLLAILAFPYEEKRVGGDSTAAAVAQSDLRDMVLSDEILQEVRARELEIEGLKIAARMKRKQEEKESGTAPRREKDDDVDLSGGDIDLDDLLKPKT